MTKQTHLTLRLTEAEANRIAADAQTAGVSVSAWVRQAVQERVQLSEFTAELQAQLQAQTADLVAKLKGISRNPADPENLIKYSTFNRLCDL